MPTAHPPVFCQSPGAVRHHEKLLTQLSACALRALVYTEQLNLDSEICLSS